ncbi:MAG TPA: hypothetical protein VMY42_05305 [Thermoguttaceae bacterium]|nr:hypothetical protein [Thermoguttaceae bacterium]
MSRSWTSVIVWMIASLVNMGAVSAEKVPRSEELLPDTTTGFIAVADMETLRKHWNDTQIGQLMADPVMKPFAEDLQAELRKRLAAADVRLGLKAEDLENVLGGEIAAAVVRLGPEQAAAAVLLDVTGHLPQAETLLEKVGADLIKRGAKRSEQQAAGNTIVRFEIPAPANVPDAEPQNAYYCLSGNLLAASDDPDVIVEILARAAKKQDGSLADSPGYLAVKQRCEKDNGGAMPQIRWFIHPLGYVEAIRAATPENERRRGKSVVELLENQGFEAIQGVGGFVDFMAEDCELVHRTFVYAPPPHEMAMKMLKFPAGQVDADGQLVPNDLAPQDWVSRDIATYTTVYCDLLNAFDNFGPLFDEVTGGELFLFSTEDKIEVDLVRGSLSEALQAKFQKARISLSENLRFETRTPGQVWKIADAGNDKFYVVRRWQDKYVIYEELTGIWDKTVRSLAEDPNGPQIHLRKDLFVHFGRRVTILTANELPIGPESERFLFAIELKDPEAVQTTISKWMAKEAANKAARKIEIEGHEAWEILEEEPPAHIPDIDIPSLTPPPGGGALPGNENGVQNNAPAGNQPLLTHAAVAVVGGHLFVASHVGFLEKVLKPKTARETLRGSPYYLLVEQRIDELKIEGQFARKFSLTEEEFRPVYEAFRRGEPMREVLFGQVINSLIGEQALDRARQVRLPGKNLPPFGVVARYLGPAGLAIAAEPNGWFAKGFTLTKP